MSDRYNETQYLRGRPPGDSRLSAVREPVYQGAGEPKQAVSGRHHTSSSRGDSLLRRHGAKFASFSMIGGGVFVAGLVIQAVLTGGLHVSSLLSYLAQAVVSVEASYFLNRWFTWKGEKSPFWPSFARFNLQKFVTVTLNLVLYAVLLKVGVEYLLDNILLTIVFTFVNYIGADRFVFLRGTQQMVAAVTGPLPVITGPMPVLRLDRRHALRVTRTDRALPSISVTIPVRSSEKTIRAAVESVLRQDYPMLRELILVGSPGDSTWLALRGINDPRLFVLETNTPPGIRDANFKRDYGIRRTTGDLIALIDSDMVIPSDWMSNAVRLLLEGEVDCVAGVMRSIHDDFWGRFVDGNRLGAKTPRAKGAYLVTAEGFGAAGYKPPITADILFTRRMYEDCPIDSSWSHGSLEDYEWFWRVVERGHKVLVSNRLFGWHHHRAGFKNLSREYRRSARGCAYFIRAHRDSPFAQKRMSQAIVLPLGLFTVVAALSVAAYLGHTLQALATIAALCVAGFVLLSAREFARNRTLESLVYPAPAVILGLNYTVSLATHLIRTSPMHSVAETAHDLQVYQGDAPRSRTGLARLLHPLTAILLLQAALSLTLIWSNTAFGDEADYLWLGRLLVEHWLHGTSWPSQYADTVLSGSPLIFPPLGAMANSLAGLAGARILSLIFMLGATALLYNVASILFGRSVAVAATVLWATTEGALKLAFATYDPLSVFLNALSAWLITRVVLSRRRGELIALAALALGLADATTYSDIVIDPIVLAFAFLVWKMRIGSREAWMFCSWLLVAAAIAFAAVMTEGHSWPGIMTTVISRSLSDKQTFLLIINDVWAYTGIVMILAMSGVLLGYATRKAAPGRFGLLALLGFAAFIVPIAQLHEQTATSMDKHLAFGMWFASMAAGYGVATAVRSLRQQKAAIVAAYSVAFIFPTISGWQSAWLNFHGWANASSFVAAIKPVLARAQGNYYAAGGVHIAEYYTPQGQQWDRWTSAGLPELTTAGVPEAIWSDDLRTTDYGFFALFYPTPFSAPNANVLLAANSTKIGRELLDEAAQNESEPGLPGLTEALESDHAYRLVAVGPYNSRSTYEIYAIWEKD